MEDFHESSMKNPRCYLQKIMYPDLKKIENVEKLFYLMFIVIRSILIYTYIF